MIRNRAMKRLLSITGSMSELRTQADIPDAVRQQMVDLEVWGDPDQPLVG